MSEAEFAKSHLRDHLSNLLISPVSEGFWSILKTAQDLCERNGQPDQVLRTFQNMLTKIPDWNDSTLTTEVERIVKTTKCSYLDDLLMGVFISYMKSFASLQYRGTSTHIDLDFDRPTMEKFIHEMYIQSARKFWQVAYLFKVTGVTNEQQARNRQEIDKIISECLEHVICSFLPWQSIAKQFSSAPTGNTPAPAEPSKRVLFEQESDSEDEVDSDMEEQKHIEISDDTAEIQVDTFDEDKPADEAMDTLKEIESKIEDKLVLNL
jgi:hypothetical protein